MKIRFVLWASVLLGSGQATAQIDQLTLNFEEIKIEYTSPAPQRLPFTLELQAQADGSARTLMRMHKATDITLKRGSFGTASDQELVELAFFERISRTGTGTLILANSNSAGPGGHVKVFSGQGSAPLLHDQLEVQVAAAGQHVELRMVPAPGATLSGQPASLFNQPARGQTLVGRVPLPAADSDIKVYIDVVYNNDPGQASVRVRWSSAPN